MLHHILRRSVAAAAILVLSCILLLRQNLSTAESTGHDELHSIRRWSTRSLLDFNVNESFKSQLNRGAWGWSERGEHHSDGDGSGGGDGNDSDIERVSPFNISVDSSYACILAPIRISLSSEMFGNAHLVVRVDGSEFVSYINVDELIGRRLGDGNRLSEAKTESTIQCANDDSIHCLPAVQDIYLDPPRKVLSLSFNTNTSRPDLRSTSKVLRALSFDPPLVGVAVGEWKSPTQLELKVDDTYITDVVNFFQANNKVDIKVRKDLVGSSNMGTSLHISRRIRIKEAGLHHIFVVNVETLSLISNVVAVRTGYCTDLLVSKYDSLSVKPDYLSSELLNSEQIIKAKPVIAVDGVLAITGQNAIEIPQSSVPGMAAGTWSLSLWVYLLESDSGEFQTLFFKGNAGVGSDNSGRTPSAWLLPSSRRLTVRCSAASNPDIGGETSKDLPQGAWSLLTFTFLNLSSSSVDSSNISNASEVTVTDSSGRSFTIDESLEEKLDLKRRHYSQYINAAISDKSKYVVSVYLNDALDVMMQFPMELIGNDGPLQLFKDISHKGPTSFASGITLWSSVLSQREVQELYLKGPPLSHKPIDLSMSMLESSLLLTSAKLASDCKKHGISPLFHAYFQSKQKDLAGGTLNSLVTINANCDGSCENASELGIGADGLAVGLDGHIDRHGRTGIDTAAAATQIFERAKAATAECASFEVRLDMYAEAASMGSIPALHSWAMLTGFGFENPDTMCGLETSFRSRQRRTMHNDNDPEYSLAQSAIALMIAVELGSASSIVPLVVLINSGLGTSAFIIMSDLSSNFNSNSFKGIPLPYFIREFNGPRMKSFHYLLSSKITSLFSIYNDNELEQSEIDYFNSDDNAVGDKSNNDIDYDDYGGLYDEENDFDHSEIIHKTMNPAIGQYLNFPLGESVWDMKVLSSVGSDAVRNSKLASINCDDNALQLTCSSVSDILSGLLHVAAVHGIAEAQAILSYRYQNGIVVEKDVESAAFYANLGSIVASSFYHRVGGQPIVEADRINDKTEFVIEKGTKGNEDEIIQAQIIRAEEGDVDAMLATADLYYYGARGLERNQPRALELFNRAAGLGNVNGKCGAAAMYLKGEGDAANTTRAIELYEEAAAEGAIRALNGLGYLYFYGQSVPKNETKAFYYFLAAADTESDGDSLFNAGFCLENGLGIPKDLKRASGLYLIAAKKFGHFDAIKNLGLMHLEGKGVPRSPSNALTYLSVAQGIGPWAAWIRRGLDHYLAADYSKALMCYVIAGEFGFEVSQSNAAFLTRRKFVGRSFSHLALRNLHLSSFHSNSISTMSIGVMHLQDKFVPGSSDSAIWWLTKASSLGNGVASMYLGAMHNFGIGTERNLYRAKRYYEHAISVESANKDIEIEPQLKTMLRTLIWLIDSSVNPGGWVTWISPILDSAITPTIEYVARNYLLPIKAIKIST